MRAGCKPRVGQGGRVLELDGGGMAGFMGRGVVGRGGGGGGGRCGVLVGDITAQ